MKRTLCILLSLMLAVTGLVGLGMSAGAANYHVGDIIEFGSYPQTEVKDDATINALNAVASPWQSYHYYVGTGDWDGQMAPSDIMSYRDVHYNGRLYRGVLISQYRSTNTYMLGTGDSYKHFEQIENGYILGRVYWFAFEPLKWRVLDPGTGLVMSEYVIDSQPFQNYVLREGKDPNGADADWGSSSKQYYTNNYEHSSIRNWLRVDFAATAFTTDARNDIIKVTMDMDNSAFDPICSIYDGVETNDKIFLLSLKDIQNTAYGFNADPNVVDPARIARNTDYARCQGVYSSTEGNSAWLLRTAGWYSFFVCNVAGSYYPYAETSRTSYGVLPAMTLDLQAYNAYLLKNAQLSAPQSATVGYKSTVTVTATASGLPDGYFVALYEDDVAMLQMGGDNTTVTYKMNKMTESRTLTAKVIDVDGNVQSNADGKLEKTITITVKTGFFDKVKAFFLGLFGLLPKVELKP